MYGDLDTLSESNSVDIIDKDNEVKLRWNIDKLDQRNLPLNKHYCPKVMVNKSQRFSHCKKIFFIAVALQVEVSTLSCNHFKINIS